MKLRPARSLVLAVAAALAVPATADGSPPACRRSDAAMVRDADLVAAGELEASRLWRRGRTRNLVGTYRLVTVLKGEEPPKAEVIVTDTCLEKDGKQGGSGPPPGYPRAIPSCGADAGVSLPGIDPATGEPLHAGDGEAGLLLFLERDERPGAPEVTWTELPRTRYGGSCHADPTELEPGDAEAYRRLEAWRATPSAGERSEPTGEPGASSTLLRPGAP